MYSDVGRKIRGFAIFCGIFIFVVCAIVWIVLITNTYETYEYSYYSGYEKVRKFNKADDGLGWGILGAGIIYFMSSWIIYGFGQMVENVESIYYLLGKVSKKLDAPSEKVAQVSPPNGPAPAATNAASETERPTVNYCTKCGHPRAEGVHYCLCGAKFD